jgi:hypothetical protein
MTVTIIGELIEWMSDCLDVGRPAVKVITVQCQRQSVLRYIPPKWQVPIEYDGREIDIKDSVTHPIAAYRERAAKARLQLIVGGGP